MIRMFVGSLVLITCLPALGSESVSVDEGHRIAEERCGRCHAIGDSGESPLAEAPHFRAFVTRWSPEVLAEALAEGIVTGHPEMPEFVFTPEEIDAFLAYLETL